LLWDAIKRSDVEKIDTILAQLFPIDHPITDTGMSALAYASSWSDSPEVFK